MRDCGLGRRRGRLLVCAAAIALLTGPLAAAPAFASDAGNPSPTSGPGPQGPGRHEHRGRNGEVDVNACSDAVPVGIAHCEARVRIDAGAASPSAGRNHAATPLVVPDSRAYAPVDLQTAYHAPSSTAGAGQTVAIVDAMDDPNAESDLATYRSTFGLPPCTTANGCFRKVDQNGGTSFPAADRGWAEEISLDLDMVSAICSQCHILLVEANSASLADLGTGVNEAVALGANAVSNSYGTSEFAFESLADSYYNHPGVAITAAGGDTGYGVDYPAASPSVVAAGGTTLTRDGTGGFTETAWSRTGSGCSAYEAKPSWQTDTGCGRRTVSDVAAVADPATGVWVNDTYGGDPGFEIFGGTSVSAPIIASFYALANNGRSSAQVASYPYAHPSSLDDVTAGSNGTCSPSYLCTAGTGYDGPTGLGTPNTAAAFSSGTPADDFSISAAPSSLSVAQGAAGSSTINTSVTTGSAQPVALAISGLPAGASASFSPSSVTAGQSATLMIDAGAATAPGTYPLTVTGTGTSATHTTDVTLTVTAVGATNDFSVTASPATISVGQGSTGSSTIGTAVTSGSPETISLSVSGVPSGTSTSFSPASVTTGQSATLTLAVSAATAPGSYPLTVTATSASATHTAAVTLTVTAVGTGIVNGTFETGTLSPWSVTGTASIGGSAHTGSYAAVVGSSSPTNGDSSIAQTFVSPAGGATLTFWYRVHCPDTVTYDWATVTLRDNTTGTTATMLGKTCTNRSAWRSANGTLAPGHSYTLTLTSHDDNYAGDATYTQYDDVTLGAPPAPSSIVNGGFETGNLNGWASSGTAGITTLSHSGNYAAQLGSSSPTTTSSLTQTFTAPSGATTITFWYFNYCPDSVTYDWATATLRDNTTGTTTTLLSPTCSALPAWTSVNGAVTPGHSYTLTLTNRDDNYAADPTFTVYDDVSVH
ncbi:MAG TPA: hypothetical protein VFC99_12340 [Acidimicrobiia bacterium]|nr:hypothetical protein [Acidimicrobiia bacterium]